MDTQHEKKNEIFNFPAMFVPPAVAAGIKVPDQEILDEVLIFNFKESHPHFFVFCRMQLCKELKYPEMHIDNAKVIAKFSEEEIKQVTPEILEEAGFTL